jgi:hypothetical protein
MNVLERDALNAAAREAFVMGWVPEAKAEDEDKLWRLRRVIEAYLRAATTPGAVEDAERLRERMADAYGCLVRMAPDERGMRDQAMALLRAGGQ